MIFETRLLISIANLYLLSYVYLLERNKCKCSVDWRRDFIFYFSLFYIFSIISFLLLPELFYRNMHLVVISKVILGILLVVNIYCLYTYADKLEKTDCKCAENFGRHFMKAFSYFYIFVIVIVFLYLINFYMKGQFKNIRHLKRLRSRVTNNNLEKVIIVNKVN